jgi:hypothetical protein
MQQGERFDAEGSDRGTIMEVTPRTNSTTGGLDL